MTPSTAAAPAATAPAGRATAAIVAIVAGGAFLAPINSTMIAVALPSLADQYRIDVADAAWLVIAYLLVMASAQPLAGRLGDSFGHRKLFVAGCVGLLAAQSAAPWRRHSACFSPVDRFRGWRRLRWAQTVAPSSGTPFPRPVGGSVRVVRRLHDSGGRNRACRRRGHHRPVWSRLDLLDQPPDTRGRLPFALRLLPEHRRLR